MNKLERKLTRLRNNIILHSQRIVNNKDNYVILDTETTGLKKNDVILQLGLIDLDGNVLMDTLIKPSKRKRFSASATAIHGISMASVKNAPTFSELYPEIRRVIRDRELLIYNAPFDVRILEQTAEQDDIELESWNATCVMNLYNGYVGEWNSHYNSIKWQKLPSGDHSAIGDCLATLKILNKMADSKIQEVPKRWWEFWLQ
ncbi:3'-5' exonuclease [Bacteroidia bacterium]|nr:3'-5' exonuclease [Bacteroidia bacterium]